MEVKQNDWLAAIFFQPDYTIQDLADLGITPDNSELKSRDYYKKLPEIQEAFKDDKGKLDEVKFNGFYNSVESVYNTASDINLAGNIVNQYSYDPRDRFAPSDAKLRDVSVKIIDYPNPYGQSRGLSATNQLGTPTLSIRESAQKNNVFNPETNTFEDYTPNDLNAFSFWTKPTLALAQYEEDGFHEVNGNMFKHKKGEYKFDEYGNPFYEILGGKNTANREILHMSDILTTDGSRWNKYDFFDSDSLEKSAIGTVVKTVASIAPYFIPGVRTVWGIAEIARQLSIALPELYKSVIGGIGMDVEKNSKTANIISGFAKRLDSSLTDDGKKRFFSLESIGNLAVDSVSQLLQQRMVWKGMSKLLNPKTPEELEFVKKMSLSYMAATSTAQSYAEFKNAGASDQVAGLGALATSLAIWKLMSVDYFKDFVLGDELERTKILPGIQNAAQEAVEVFGQGAEIQGKKKMVEWLTNTTNTLFKNSIAQGSLNEGIEEVAEEMTMDAVKGLASALHALGLADKDSNYNFGFSVKDIASRYGSSFIGGAVGGAIFSGYGNYENWLEGKKLPEEITPNNLSELVFYFRNGYGDKIKYHTTKLYNSGKLASKSLSFNSRQETTDEGTKQIFESATSGNSQNDIIYKYLLNQYQLIENILKKENLLINDDRLQALVTALPEQFEGLSDEEKRDHATFIFEQFAADKLENGLATRILEDFQDIATKIVNAESTMQRLLTPETNSSKTPGAVDEHIAAVKKTAEYKTLENRLKELRKERDEILYGRKSQYYFEQGLFLSTPMLVDGFISDFGIKRYAKIHYGKHFNELSKSEQDVVKQKYEEYLNSEAKDLVFTAFEVFKNLSEKLNNDLVAQAKRARAFKDVLYKDVNIFSEVLAKKQEELAKKNAALETDSENETLLLEQRQLYSEIETLSKDPMALIAFSVKNDVKVANNYDVDLGTLSSYVDVVKKYDGYLDFADNNVKRLLLALADASDNYYDQSPEFKLAVKSAISSGDSEWLEQLNYEIWWEGDFDFTGLIDVLQKIESLKKSPAEELLLTAIDYLDGGSGIYNELYNLFKEFVSKNSIDSFEILDDITIDNLNKLQSLLDIMARIVIAANDGDYNSVVNNLYNSNKAVLDRTSSEELLGDLSKMRQRIELVLNIGDSNRVAQKNIQKKLYYNMRIKLLYSILDSEKKEELQKEFNVDLEKLYAQCEFPETVSEGNFDEYEAAAIKFETLFRNTVFENIKEAPNKNEEVISKVFSIYGNKMFADKPTVFSADEDMIISDRDKALYLLSILATPSDIVNINYRTLISGDDYLLAPLYPQEYVVKMLYSFARNPEFFSRLQQILTTKYQEYANSYAGLADNDKTYLLARKGLNNFLPIILGGAGVGKTKAILYSVYKLLKNNNADFVAVGPKETQLSNLLKTLQLGENKGYSIDDFLTKIFGRPYTENDHMFDGVFTLTKDAKQQLNNSQNVLFSPKTTAKYLILDEVGTITAPVLEAINIWAHKNNVLVIPAGDLKQIRPKLKYTKNNKVQYNTTGLEDFVTLQCPELQTAIRPEYVAKFKNYSTLTEVLNKAYYALQENPLTTASDLNRLVSDQKIELLWGRDGDEHLVGEYIALLSEKEELLKEISSYDNVAVVVENDKYKEYEYLKSTNKNIKVLTAESAIGLEFDYVILITDLTENNNSYDVLSKLYTSSQRSRKATVLIPTGIDVGTFLESKFDIRAANNISFDDTTIAEFKDWRINLLQKVEDYQPQITGDEQGVAQDISDPSNAFLQPSPEDNASPVVSDEEVGDVESPSPEPTTPSVVHPSDSTVLAEVTPGISNDTKPAVVRGGITYRTDWAKMATYMMGGESEDSFIKDVKAYIANTKFANCDLDRVVKLFNKISWYIKAGYYKTENATVYLSSIDDTIQGMLGPDNSVDKIFKGLSKNTFSIISEDDKVVAVINGIKVPLFILKESLNVPINVSSNDISFAMQKNDMKYNHNTPVHIPITRFQNIFTISAPKILTVKKQNGITDDNIREFVMKNSGSTFRLFSADPFVSAGELNGHFKEGKFNSDANDNLVSYSKATSLLLAIESGRSATEILENDQIQINAHTGSKLFMDLLSIDTFKKMFRTYLEDNVQKQPQIIVQKGSDPDGRNIQEIIQFTFPVDVDSISRNLNTIISRADWGENYKINIQLNGYKNPIAIYTTIRYMQKVPKFRTSVAQLKDLNTNYHVERKIEKMEDAPDIWSATKTLEGEAVNIELTQYPGFQLIINGEEVENINQSTDPISHLSLLSLLNNEYASVEPKIYDDSWNGGLFLVTLHDGSKQYIQRINEDVKKLNNFDESLLNNVYTKEYIRALIQNGTVANEYADTVYNNIINNEELFNALALYENEINFNKCN